jgi:hypothetical protein
MSEALQKIITKKHIAIVLIVVVMATVCTYGAYYSISKSILFTPRVPSSAPFISVGMTKAQVIQLWGPPHEIERVGTPDELWSYYHGEGMIDPWAWPYCITFDAQGNVENIWS